MNAAAGVWPGVVIPALKGDDLATAVSREREQTRSDEASIHRRRGLHRLRQDEPRRTGSRSAWAPRRCWRMRRPTRSCRSSTATCAATRCPRSSSSSSSACRSSKRSSSPDLFARPTIADFTAGEGSAVRPPHAQTTPSTSSTGSIFEHVKPQAPMPDLVVYLQASVDTLIARVREARQSRSRRHRRGLPAAPVGGVHAILLQLRRTARCSS